MDLNFHQTFKPERAYISELLQSEDEAAGLTLEQLSNLTGIPQGKSSGKLVPHLKYAKLMGLLDYTVENKLYTIKLTDLGKIIHSEDVSLSENISLLALHHNIINKNSGADLWAFCFNDYFSKYGKDSKYEYFTNEVERQFGNTKLGPFQKSYEELFAPLGLLEIDAKANSISFNSFEYHQEYNPVIGYIFYDLWDQVFPKETEITSIQLDEMQFRNRFGWTKLEEQEMLERLNDSGLIRINKQLVPFTIIRLDDTNNIINTLYRELI